MVWRAADNRDPLSWATRFRRRRFAIFTQLLETIHQSTVSILDIGGTTEFWKQMTAGANPTFHVTLINTEPSQTSIGWIQAIVGDARALPFLDGSFDVAFSNSVIEHVGGRADQERMAAELSRVARRYFVQTPNYWFFIEPHYLFPGFQFLPLWCRAVLSWRFTLGWVSRPESYARARAQASSIRLLTASELRTLFPGSELRAERIGPFVKSWIACGGWLVRQ